MGVIDLLNKYGKIGVESLKNDVQKVSATGETAASIYYEIEGKDGVDTLRIIGRKFFKALETGRGPRKSSQEQGYTEKMYEYMQARGIGSDLTEKKRKQLARFLVYRINKEGDSVYKSGGRVVYSKTLNKFVDELTQAVRKDLTKSYIKEITRNFKPA